MATIVAIVVVTGVLNGPGKGEERAVMFSPAHLMSRIQHRRLGPLVPFHT